MNSLLWRQRGLVSLLVVQLSVAACGDNDIAIGAAVAYTEQRAACSDRQPLRKALFGDLHVHSAYSYDASASKLETLPEDAYRFARGESIPFYPLDESGKPVGTISLQRPLDFASVTDHAEFLGETALCRTPGSPSYATEFCETYRSSPRQSLLMLGSIVTLEKPERVAEICGVGNVHCIAYAERIWAGMIAAAEAAYDRSAGCQFTSLIGYEYTGTPGLSNIHRNVIFRNNNVPQLPVSYLEAPRDYLLWQALDVECRSENGCSYLTIPHNSNLSNGRMFALLEGDDHEHQAGHARQRLQHEPVMEIFQHKGNSECMNGLASVFGEPDEFCELESVRTLGERKQVMDVALQDGKLAIGSHESQTDQCGEGTGAGGILGAGCVAESDFYRSNLLKGLRDERLLGVNSAKLGVIAGTDTHNATPGAVSEKSWRGHVSSEARIEDRLKPGLLPTGIDANPGGLAGVWAIENSRDAIFSALQRREVFGTSGPRIKPRLFGGWHYPDNLCDEPTNLEIAYRDGVAMGSDLEPGDDVSAPVFFASAEADPGASSTLLQQLQLVKGWINDAGELHYKVYSIAGSVDNGAGVDIESGEIFGDGHQQLCAVFEDPDFDAAQASYYYLRVLENPSPRWSLLDCLRLPADHRPAVCDESSAVPKTVQETAWSSPIWYKPADSRDNDI